MPSMTEAIAATVAWRYGGERIVRIQLCAGVRCAMHQQVAD